MDTTFGLCATIFVGETDESSFSLESISKPLCLVSLELEVLECDGTILWNWDGIFGITDGWVSLSVKWVMWNLVVRDGVESVF
jgi:hypothetical protein